MSTSTLFPEPLFAPSCGEKEGLPAVAIINVGLANYGSCVEFPWLVELEITAEETSDNGLPTLEELDHLNEIEEQIQTLLSADGAHFIARQAWNGRRMLDFYVADGKAARRTLNTLIKEGSLKRKLTVRTSEDPNWNTWMPTLANMCQTAEKDGSALNAFEQSVLVRIPLRGGEFGSDEEQEAIMELADELNETTANTPNCAFDGYEFGNSEALLFAYGNDADALFSLLKPKLSKARIARGAEITKRYGRHEDEAALEAIFAL